MKFIWHILKMLGTDALQAIIGIPLIMGVLFIMMLPVSVVVGFLVNLTNIPMQEESFFKLYVMFGAMGLTCFVCPIVIVYMFTIWVKEEHRKWKMQ